MKETKQKETEAKYSFMEALQHLKSGRCKGIRPSENLSYMVESQSCLVWKGSTNGTCRIDQFINYKWSLVEPRTMTKDEAEKEFNIIISE